MSPLLTIEEAQARILERAAPLPAETVALEQAWRRVVREPVRAAVDLPPFPSSAMDGFAVRSADTPGRLRVVWRIAAGRPATRPLEPGEAMGIATGAVVPDGADAVVPVEYVVEHGNSIVEVPDSIEPGRNIRPRAGDVRAGDVVADSGVLVTAARLGALAAAGVAEVECGSRPRAAVVATGSELRQPGSELAPGQVYEANGVMLGAQLASAGALAERLPAAADDEDVHRAALERALEADVVVTSGGVSVGPHDLVRRVARELGVEEVFWGVSVKPGKPLAFGVRGRTLVFGLPGNPVSSLVGFELFVRPALLGLQGADDPLPRFEAGVLGAPVRQGRERDELLRARMRRESGETVLEPLSGQESHMIVRAGDASALLFVPRGDGELRAGSACRYLRLEA